LIPKEKIVDSVSTEKAFQEIKHDHEGGGTRLQKVRCERCHYDRAEQSLIDYIKGHSGKETMKAKDINGVMKTYVFKNISVARGRYDDCMGWSTGWS